MIGALLLGGWILRPLERLRGTSARLAGGELNARALLDGPREVADVGRSFNEMARRFLGASGEANLPEAEQVTL